MFRRRRLVALAVLLVASSWSAALLLRGGGGRGSRAPRAAARGGRDKPVELPRGGRRLLPDRRIVAFYGAPQDDELGELGIGSPASAARRLERQAQALRAARSRPVLPAMELIAVTAAAHPGEGGRYNTRQDDAVIERYLRAARKAKALLVLDIQPGRSDFFTEATRLERWLAEPDVGLALDPEWRMGPGEVPGKVIGSVEAREVNAVSEWLAQIVERNKLPQKLLPHPPVHRRHGRRHPAAGAAGAGDGAERRRLRDAGAQARQVPTRSPPRRGASSTRASSSSTVRTRT